MRSILPLLLLLALAGPALAVDGVLEINQTCATTSGCFSGDLGGFPVDITNPGSYRLTGNLQVPDASTSAITITADDVTLDLNGFALLGVTTCSGDPVTSCTPIGLGSGVFSTAVNVTVKNGTIRGMGNDGIDGFLSVRVTDVVAIENGDHGISCRSACRVIGSQLLRNGGAGVRQSGLNLTPKMLASMFTGNIIAGNADRGIFTNDLTSVVIGNAFYGNGGTGLGLFASGGYAENTFTANNDSSGLGRQLAGGTPVYLWAMDGRPRPPDRGSGGGMGPIPRTRIPLPIEERPFEASPRKSGAARHSAAGIGAHIHAVQYGPRRIEVDRILAVGNRSSESQAVVPIRPHGVALDHALAEGLDSIAAVEVRGVALNGRPLLRADTIVPALANRVARDQ